MALALRIAAALPRVRPRRADEREDRTEGREAGAGRGDDTLGSFFARGKIKLTGVPFWPPRNKRKHARNANSKTSDRAWRTSTRPSTTRSLRSPTTMAA